MTGYLIWAALGLAWLAYLLGRWRQGHLDDRHLRAVNATWEVDCERQVRLARFVGQQQARMEAIRAPWPPADRDLTTTYNPHHHDVSMN